MDTARSAVALVWSESGGSSCRGIFAANSSGAYLVMCPFRHEGTCCWDGEAWRNGEGDASKWSSCSAAQSLCSLQARVLHRCIVRLHEISDQEYPFSFHRVVAVGLVQSTEWTLLALKSKCSPITTYIHTKLIFSPLFLLHSAHLLPIYRVSHAREGTSAAKPAAAVRSTARSGSSKWAAPPP